MKSTILFSLVFGALFLPTAKATGLGEPGISHESSCLQQAILVAEDNQSVKALRELCKPSQGATDASTVETMPTATSFEPVSELEKRLLQEQITQDKAFVITPYRQNYILIGTYNDRPNQSPFLRQQSFPEYNKPMKHEEVKMQISFKVPLNEDDLFIEGDNLYFGFTLKSFWQLYNKKLSAPFRETNYRPEIFYQAPLNYRFMGGDFFFRTGMEHESNGRSQWLSRSWNRLYVGLGYQRSNWAMYIQPWYRLPESEKVFDSDPNTPPPAKGDDNPDIHKYFGHYEFLAVYKNNGNQLSGRFRHNLNSGKGAVEVGYSFPLHHRIKGYVQYFYGYGESLIDYDHLVNRIGIGVLLTDFL